MPIIGTDPLGQFIIFIGGAADDITTNVEYYAWQKYRYRSAYFFHWTWNSTIKSVIDSVKADNPNEPIAMVGHSYGGDTATEFVQQYPDLIDALITVDPVGWNIPSSADIQVNHYWYNIDAVPSDGWDSSDYIAWAGYEWGSDIYGVSDYYQAVDAHHAGFWGMMNYANLDYYNRSTNHWGEYGQKYWDMP